MRVAAGAAWWRVQFPPRAMQQQSFAALHRRAPIPGCRGDEGRAVLADRLTYGHDDAQPLPPRRTSPPWPLDVRRGVSNHLPSLGEAAEPLHLASVNPSSVLALAGC
jgi:hypothetical protein